MIPGSIYEAPEETSKLHKVLYGTICSRVRLSGSHRALEFRHTGCSEGQSSQGSVCDMVV